MASLNSAQQGMRLIPTFKENSYVQGAAQRRDARRIERRGRKPGVQHVALRFVLFCLLVPFAVAAAIAGCVVYVVLWLLHGERPQILFGYPDPVDICVACAHEELGEKPQRLSTPITRAGGKRMLGYLIDPKDLPPVPPPPRQEPARPDEEPF